MYKQLVSNVRGLANSRTDPKPLFYLPLDLDTARSVTDIKTFVQCMEADADGRSAGWGFKDGFDRWMFSISLPLNSAQDVNTWVASSFLPKAQAAAEATTKDMVFVVGTASVQVDSFNAMHLVEDHGSSEKGMLQQQVLVQVWNSIQTLSTEVAAPGSITSGIVRGLILDEWADDWDRGRHGVFAIADGQEKNRKCGGRYRHDTDGFGGWCLKEGGLIVDDPSANIRAPALEFFGLTGQTTFMIWHCVSPRFASEKGLNFCFGNSCDGPNPWEYCQTVTPSLWYLFVMAICGVAAIVLHFASQRRRKLLATEVMDYFAITQEIEVGINEGSDFKEVSGRYKMVGKCNGRPKYKNANGA
jgi:hypothetical protein